MSNVVLSTDLYPTFVQLSEHKPKPAIDGRSLVPLLHPTPDAPPLKWPTVALDRAPRAQRHPIQISRMANLGGDPHAYEAIRLSNRQFGNAIYVEYTRTGKREYDNIDRGPRSRGRRSG